MSGVHSSRNVLRKASGWVALTLASGLATAQTEPVEGLLNGDFEIVLANGTLQKTQLPVDGGFWVGAEGRTATSGGNRFLELSSSTLPAHANSIVTQRVGAPGSATATARLSARVLVPAGDEARITLSEGNGGYWMLEWVLRKPFRIFYKEGAPFIRWECWEVDPGLYGSSTPVRMPFMQPNGAGGVLEGFTSTGASGNVVERTGLRLASDVNGYVELRWKAPQAGHVRVLARPWRPLSTESASEDIVHEIWRHSPLAVPADVLVRADTLEHGDFNGPILIERVQVAAGDEIRLRVVRQWDGAAPAANHALLHWWPVILYEGRSLTYRLGSSLGGCAAQPGEEFICSSVPAGVWHSLSLNAGADFESRFGSPAKAPLDVKLSAQSGSVSFDDLACSVDFEAASEAGFRAAAVAEARWLRDHVLGWDGQPGILDRDGNGWTRGWRATAYDAHTLDIEKGPLRNPPDDPTVVEATTRTGPPTGLLELLLEEYDAVDASDYFLTLEWQARLQNTSPVGLTYSQYDFVRDAFLRGTANYAAGVTPNAEAELATWKITNDPTYLDRAFARALVAARHGVIVDDSSFPTTNGRRGLIAHRGYDIDTGVNHIPLDADNFWGCNLGCGIFENFGGHHVHLEGLSSILQTYAACKAFNHASGVQRYPTADLTLMRDTCRTAVSVGISMINPSFPNAGFLGIWQAFHGNFNDNFGNQAGDALNSYGALEDLESVVGSLDPVEDSMRVDLRDVWIVGGTDHFFPMWEQAAARYEFMAGDSVRGWIPYHQAVTQGLATTTPAQAIKTQLVRAAFNTLKYQYADEQFSGVWTAGGMDRFQLLDISGGNGGGLAPAATYPFGVSLAHALLSDTIPQEAAWKADLRAAMLANLRSNQAHFRANYGYWSDLIEHSGRQDWRTATRAIASFLKAIPNVPDPGRMPAPITSISPPSLQHKSGPRDYVFSVTLPGTPTPAELQDLLLNRTTVRRWFLDGSDWSVEELWPQQASAFAISRTPSSVRLTLHGVPPPGPGFKFTVSAWHSKPDGGRWSRDTSLQEP